MAYRVARIPVIWSELVLFRLKMLHTMSLQQQSFLYTPAV